MCVTKEHDNDSRIELVKPGKMLTKSCCSTVKIILKWSILESQGQITGWWRSSHWISDWYEVHEVGILMKHCHHSMLWYTSNMYLVYCVQISYLCGCPHVNNMVLDRRRILWSFSTMVLPLLIYTRLSSVT